MNIYKSLNEIIEYIEKHLEDKIDYTVLTKMLGVNEYTMQRIFSLLCNIPLAEYIRKRRLSIAGNDLYSNNEKVIDIAIKYQYDNATSFSRAFEKFHGIKPSKVKDNPSGLKNFPKIKFNENINYKQSIEYDIVELDKIVLYGKGIKTHHDSIETDAPTFFQEMRRSYVKLYGEPNYGMTVYENRFESDNYEYWVLYDKEIKEFTKYEIPKSKWLRFHIDSFNSKDIHNLSQEFYLDFMPSCHYNLKSIPELEFYHDNVTDFLVALED